MTNITSDNFGNDPGSTRSVRDALRERLNKERLYLEGIRERTRQQREIFEQRKREDLRWNKLRRLMCYFSMVVLGIIMIVASYILLKSPNFSATVVASAGAALFGDVLGLVIVVWKIVLNPSYTTRLIPTIEINQLANELGIPRDREIVGDEDGRQGN